MEIDFDVEVNRLQTGHELGKVVCLCVHETKAQKAMMYQHEHGFVVAHYRLYFHVKDGRRIPDTDHWVKVRHQEWSSTKLFDVLDERYKDVDPVGIPGDIE